MSFGYIHNGHHGTILTATASPAFWDHTIGICRFIMPE